MVFLRQPLLKRIINMLKDCRGWLREQVETQPGAKINNSSMRYEQYFGLEQALKTCHFSGKTGEKGRAV